MSGQEGEGKEKRKDKKRKDMRKGMSGKRKKLEGYIGKDRYVRNCWTKPLTSSILAGLREESPPKTTPLTSMESKGIFNCL